MPVFIIDDELIQMGFVLFYQLTMSDDWCVVTGEDSEEAKTEKLREMTVLEAVYPRFSAIPPR